MIRKVKSNNQGFENSSCQDKIIESTGYYLIKAASKEYYEGKIDMTGRKTAYFAELETMFLFN
jgi:hypothetical protein